MSAVTKLFIVLLVVCSLLLVAATVVFVNRVEDYKTKYTAESDRRQLADKAVATANSEAASAKAYVDMRNAQCAAEVNQYRTLASEASKTLDEVRQQLEAVRKQKDSTDKQHLADMEILKSAQAAVTLLEGQVNGLRNEKATIEKTNGDLNVELTRVSKELAVAKEQIRLSQEEIADLKDQVNKGVKAVSTNGATPAMVAPAIVGLVEKITPWNNQVFATVNVGSVDRVEKGMKFHVVDGGNYMGTLTIMEVESNTAFGRLEGPKVSQVKKDMQVRTHMSAS